MSNFNDLFEQEVNGTKSRGVYSDDQAMQTILRARTTQTRNNGGIDIVNPRIDEIWGGYVPTGAPHSYFDYYFSGQDIRVYVDGTADDPEFSNLPIIQLGFNETQKKEPVFGFWSYCVDTATEALTMRGWLKWDQINEDDFILSMDSGQLKWSTIKSIYRGYYNGLLFKMDNANIDALVTPGHKWALDSGELIKTEDIKTKDRIRIMGDPLIDEVQVYSNEFVELVGWYVTEGHDRKDVEAIEIAQSQSHNPGYVERIRSCFGKLEVGFSEWTKSSSQVVKFYIGVKQPIIKELKRAAPEKVLSINFIMALTTSQRDLLIATMLDGDGSRPDGSGRQYVQKDQAHVDAFVALCAMAGIATTTSLRSDSNCYTVTLKWRNVSKGHSIDFHGGKNNYHYDKSSTKHSPTTPYSGWVWCPETEYGTFVARRNGRVYVTGNTYDGVMRGTRVVSGQITFATKAPDYMRRLLSKAAQARALNAGGVYYKNYRTLTDDDTNIEQFWGRNIDPAITAQGKHIFSVHPPFNLIIVYGIQSISLNPMTYDGDRYDLWDQYDQDTPLALDINERLVESDPQDQASRIILEAVELVDKSTGFGPDGAVISETYNFFARDTIIPSRPSGVATSPNALTGPKSFS